MFLSITDNNLGEFLGVITLIGAVAGERRESELKLPWENDIVSSFDDGQSLNTYVGCNHLSSDSIGGRQSFGDSTGEFWLSL